MLTIIESGPKAWALAAADGDLRVYSREEAGEWSEVILSEDSEEIDGDGSSILEALYEQYATTGQNGGTAPPQAEHEGPEDEQEEPEDEQEQPEDLEEEDEDEDEAPEDEDEDEAPEDDEEERPRRRRARTRAKQK